MGFKKPLIYYLLLTMIGSLKASKIEEAYKALDIYDYFKAKKLFYAQLHKSHKTAAAYGLATIFYRIDNPFHNLDSASKYISRSGNFFRTGRLKEQYARFAIDSAAISALADSIAVKQFLKASKGNDPAALERFVLNNPYSDYARKNAALFLRDELQYKICIALNSIDTTREFILRFPESFYHGEMLTFLDQQIFDEETSLKTPGQLTAFIKKYPANKFVGQAQDELFDIYKKNRNIPELDFYVKNYPGSHFINEAWKLLYALSVKSYNNSELQAFMERYPGFPFRASINKEIELNNKILIPVNDSDYIGFIDTSGKYVIPPVYDAAMPFREGLSVVIKNDSAFFVNKENENVFKAFYTEAFPFINGIAPVNTEEQWFLINRQGQKAAGPFEDLSEQSENIYIIKQNSRYGAIDIYGNYIIQPQFDKMGDFKNGAAYYSNNNLYGFVRKNGTHSQPRYQWISDFSENRLALVKENDGYGIINYSDSLVLPAKYDLIVKGKNNIYIVVKNNKYGFFSGEGCFLSDIDYDFRKELGADFYTNGKLFKLLKKQKQALMDANGKLTIDFGTYEEVNFAQDNLIRIKRNGKYGFADRKLSLAIPCRYNYATDFANGTSIVTLKKEMALINTKGETTFTTRGTILPVTEGYFLVKEEEGDRIINGSGKLLFAGVQSYQLSPEGYLVVEFENNSKKVVKL